VRKNRRELFWYFVAALAVGSFIFRGFLFREGILFGGELKTSVNYWDWLKPYFSAWSNSGSYGFATTPYYIAPGMPEFYAYSLPFMAPLIFIYAIFSSLFSTSGLLMVYIFTFPLQYFGIYYLLPHFGVKKHRAFFSFVAFLIFVLNPYKVESVNALGMIYGINHGLWLLWVGSLASILFKKSKKIFSYRYLIFIFLTWLVSTVAIGMMIITLYSGLALVLYDLINAQKSKDFTGRNYTLKFSAYTFLLIFLINANHLLPTIFSKMGVLQTTTSSYPLPNKFIDVITVTHGSQFAGTGNLLLWIIPLLAMLGLIFGKLRGKITILIIFLAGLILAVGLNNPFGQINSFLYNYVPFFDFGRSAHRFIVLVVLAYSLGITSLLYRMKNFKLVRMISAVGLIIAMLFIIYPSIFSGYVNKNLTVVEPPPEYFQLNDWLKDNGYQERPVLFLSPLYKSSVQVYSWMTENAYLIPYDAVFNMPTDNVGGFKNAISPAARFHNYLSRQIVTNSELATNMIETAGVELVILDNKMTDPEFLVAAQKILDASKCFSSQNSVEGFSIYKYQKQQNVEGVDLLVGSLQTLSLSNVSRNYIFLNQAENKPLEILKQCPKCRVVFDEKDIQELVFNQLVGKYELNPIIKLQPDLLLKGGWVKSGDLHIPTTEHGIFSLGKNPVGTAAVGKFSYQTNSVDTSQDLVLLIRYLKSPGNNSTLVIKNGAEVIGELNSHSWYSQYQNAKFEISANQFDRLIYEKNIVAEMGGNIIDATLLVPKDVYQNTQTQIMEVLADMKVINNIDELKDINTEVVEGFSKRYISYNLDWQTRGDKIAGNYFATATLTGADIDNMNYPLRMWFILGWLILILTWTFLISKTIYEEKN